MQKDTFLTIQEKAEGFYKEKGSKFIALAFPVKTEEEIKEQLAALKKEYYAARHHCYAYMLGRDRKVFRANDDGEPSNSAGMPILGQIRSKELTNIFIVVIRYFGGTKLGVGGLINAYKTAAAEALENADIVEEVITYPIKTRFEYPQMNDIMKIGKDYQLDMSDQSFDEKCSIQFYVRENLLKEVLAKLEKVEGIEIDRPTL